LKEFEKCVFLPVARQRCCIYSSVRLTKSLRISCKTCQAVPPDILLHNWCSLHSGSTASVLPPLTLHLLLSLSLTLLLHHNLLKNMESPFPPFMHGAPKRNKHILLTFIPIRLAALKLIPTPCPAQLVSVFSSQTFLYPSLQARNEKTKSSYLLNSTRPEPPCPPYPPRLPSSVHGT